MTIQVLRSWSEASHSTLNPKQAAALSEVSNSDRIMRDKEGLGDEMRNARRGLFKGKLWGLGNRPDAAADEAEEKAGDEEDGNEHDSKRGALHVPVEPRCAGRIQGGVTGFRCTKQVQGTVFEMARVALAL